MKNLTQELKDKSIAKWEEIKKKLENKNEDLSYYEEYWTPCGFCKAALLTWPTEIPGNYLCNYCALAKQSSEGFLVCDNGDEESHTYRSLELGDWADYEEALVHANIVLEAIKNTPVDSGTK